MNRDSLRPARCPEILSVLKISALSKLLSAPQRSLVTSFQLQALVSLQLGESSLTKSEDFPAKAALPLHNLPSCPLFTSIPTGRHYLPHCILCPSMLGPSSRLADSSLTESLARVACLPPSLPSSLTAPAFTPTLLDRCPLSPPFWVLGAFCLCLTLPSQSIYAHSSQGSTSELRFQTFMASCFLLHSIQAPRPGFQVCHTLSPTHLLKLCFLQLSHHTSSAPGGQE